MDKDSLRQALRDAREFILWAELAGILHDIGKLSNAFYEYRRTWRTKDNGWDIDPHDHQFLENYDSAITEPEFGELKVCLEKPLSALHPAVVRSLFPDSGSCSIASLVNNHIHPLDSMGRLLSAADGKDAALDRNNPLFTADQTGGTVFDTDVFGSEYGRPFDATKADGRREELYEELVSLLPEYLRSYQLATRQQILDAIMGPFDKAFSDTTRPDNDTSLWEHCYAVGTLFKALVAHKVIYGKALDVFQEVRFAILGVGWDGLAFLSQGEKIGDIAGRQPILAEVKAYARHLMEFEYALGNSIYDDDDGIYFLVPSISGEAEDARRSDKKAAYVELLRDTESLIESFAIRTTQGDLQPRFYKVENTKFVTQITRCIEELKGRTALPLWGMPESTIETLKQAWAGQSGREVCPICLRRPVGDEKAGQRKICRTCYYRRAGFYRRDARKGDTEENRIADFEKKELTEGTPFIQEIVRANKAGRARRAALIVAKFDLSQWLNGRMVRSLFITEARGLENELRALGSTKCFEADEKAAKRVLETLRGNLVMADYDYRRILDETGLCNNYGGLSGSDRKYAENVVFLYHRRTGYDEGKKRSVFNRSPAELKNTWPEWLENTRDEYAGQRVEVDGVPLLANIVCAKTPTPSTVLDVWRTTHKFFEDFRKEAARAAFGVEEERRPRAVIRRPLEPEVSIGAAYEAMIQFKGGEVAVEVVWLTDHSALIIGQDWAEELRPRWSGAELILDGKPWNRGDIAAGTLGELAPYSYRPYRMVTTSPHLLIAIVPADRALPVTRNIYADYVKRFGKAMGRLPLSIGNIFFDEHTPMFVVLDSARRMIRNFETLAGPEPTVTARVSRDHTLRTKRAPDSEQGIVIRTDQVNWRDCPPLERVTEWQLPHLLGDGAVDYHHPYFLVEPSGGQQYDRRKNYFRTVVGEVVHFTELQPGDIIRMYPNCYDFEFLDATTRRYDLTLDIANTRRRSNAAGFGSKPYLLDDLTEGLEALWQSITEPGGGLMPGLTDTQLRNLETLWLDKLKEWDIDPVAPDANRFSRWSELVEATLRNEFSRYRDLTEEKTRADLERLKSAVLTGLFFDCLELHLRILKDRVGKDTEGG